MKLSPPFISRSLPLLGHALEFSRNREALFRRGFEEKGKIFGIRLGPKKAVVLTDPSHAGIFFKETDKTLNMDKPYRFLKHALGDVAFLSSHEEYLKQRPMMMAPFTREKMNLYLEIIQRTVQKWLDQLPDEGTMELTDEINHLVQEVAGRCILGDEIQDEIGKDFWKHYANIGRSLDPLLPPNLPLPKFIRRNRSRKALGKILSPILKARRAYPQQYDDFLQDIINAQEGNGDAASDEIVIGMVLALLFAGHETTAGQAAWTIILTLQHGEYQDLVEQEIRELLPYGTQLKPRLASALRHVRWAVDETTRLKPSAETLIRLAEEDIDLGDYLIPKGHVVFLANSVLQSSPEIYTQADQFDPLRFSPGRAEHKKVRNSITGFGGGIHKCSGMNLANNEMLTIMALLFQQFELELITPDPVSIYDLGAARPSKTWIRYRRRNLGDLVAPKVMEEGLAAGCPHLARLAEQP